MQKGIH